MTRGSETNGETNGVRLGGKKQGWPHWTTPKHVLDLVHEVNAIALDPCSNPHAHTNMSGLAKACWESRALDDDWHHQVHPGLVFVNPPYDKAKDFVKKCVLEALAGCEIVLLVAARTDTRWAHACFTTAQAVCFWGPGRIRFENPPPDSDGDAPSIPSMLVYWGKNTPKFLSAFKESGFCVDLMLPRLKGKTFPVQVRP